MFRTRYIVTRYEGGLLDVKDKKKATVQDDNTTAKKGMSKKKTAKLVADLLGEALKPVNDAIAGITSKLNEKPADKKDDVPDDLKDLPPAVRARLLAGDTKIGDLEKTMRQLKEDKEASDKRAEKADREAKINDALGKYHFINDEAKHAARRLIEMEVARDDKTGELIAGGLPLGDFVNEALTKKHDYFLAKEDVGGSGAGKGITRAPQTGTQIEDIKPNMTQDERLAVTRAIAAAAGAANAA